MTAAPDAGPWYSTAGAGERMGGISADTVLAMINDRTLEASNAARYGRPRWRISQQEITRYMAARRREAKRPAGRRNRSMAGAS